MPAEVRIDSAGRFRIGGLRPGKYRVEASATRSEDHEPLPKPVAVGSIPIALSNPSCVSARPLVARFSRQGSPRIIFFPVKQADLGFTGFGGESPVLARGPAAGGTLGAPGERK